MNLNIENPVLAVVYAWVKDSAFVASTELRQQAKEMTERATEAYKSNWGRNYGWNYVFDLKDKAASLEVEATRIENLICFRSLWIFCGWKSLTWTTEMILVLKKELETGNQFCQNYRDSLPKFWDGLGDEGIRTRSLGEKKQRYIQLRAERIREEISILEKLERLAEVLRSRTYPEVDQDEAGNILADFYHRILTGETTRPF